jgi:hypothetical protein
MGVVFEINTKHGQILVFPVDNSQHLLHSMVYTVGHYACVMQCRVIYTSNILTNKQRNRNLKKKSVPGSTLPLTSEIVCC